MGYELTSRVSQGCIEAKVDIPVRKAPDVMFARATSRGQTHAHGHFVNGRPMDGFGRRPGNRSA